MPLSDPTGSTVVELSRAEQWVVHHVLLQSIGLAEGERADAAPDDETLSRNIAVLEKVEAGDFAFTPKELALLKRACGEHAEHTGAAADRNLASAVAKRIDATTDEPLATEE